MQSGRFLLPCDPQLQRATGRTAGDGTSSSTQHGQTIPVATCRDKRIFLRLIDVPRVTGGSRNWSACGESWGGREHLLGRPGTEILEPTRLGRDSRRTPLRCAPAEPFSQRSVAADPSCRNGGWIEGLSRSSSRSGETVGFEQVERLRVRSLRPVGHVFWFAYSSGVAAAA